MTGDLGARGSLARALRNGSLVLAVATLGLGLLVLFGWYTGNRTLVQVLPQFVPMQYNTALGFVLCGAGLLFRVLGRDTASRAAGALAAAIGVSTLFEYVGGVDLGIDEFFMKHEVTVATSHPGRMAPNTAASSRRAPTTARSCCASPASCYRGAVPGPERALAKAAPVP